LGSYADQLERVNPPRARGGEHGLAVEQQDALGAQALDE
jgi:hypothetical protein